MNRRRSADAISAAVSAYCDAIEVPEFDEAAIAARGRQRERMIERARGTPLRVAACAAAAVVLLLILGNIPAVVAGVERLLQAFSVTAGRTTPMTIRVVDLEHARADMPFAIVTPPPLAGAPMVAVEEMDGAGTRSDPSVIFEIHGTTPGREVMIVETKAAGRISPTLFSIRGPADRAGSRPLRSLGPPVSRGRRVPGVVLRGSFEGRAFAPTTWVAHDTRIVVMSPPGFLTDAQMLAIRRAMSR